MPFNFVTLELWLLGLYARHFRSACSHASIFLSIKIPALGHPKEPVSLRPAAKKTERAQDARKRLHLKAHFSITHKQKGSTWRLVYSVGTECCCSKELYCLRSNVIAEEEGTDPPSEPDLN